jgi:hypothetical protein
MGIPRHSETSGHGSPVYDLIEEAPRLAQDPVVLRQLHAYASICKEHAVFPVLSRALSSPSLQ